MACLSIVLKIERIQKCAFIPEIPMAPKHWLDETTDDDQSTHHIVQVHVAEVHVQPEIVEEKAAEDIGNNDEVSITKDVDIPTMQVI